MSLPALLYNTCANICAPVTIKSFMSALSTSPCVLFTAKVSYICHLFLRHRKPLWKEAQQHCHVTTRWGEKKVTIQFRRHGHCLQRIAQRETRYGKFQTITWERKVNLSGRTEFPGRSLLWFKAWPSTNTELIWSLHGFKGQFITNLLVTPSKHRHYRPAHQSAEVLSLEEGFIHSDLQELC